MAGKCKNPTISKFSQRGDNNSANIIGKVFSSLKVYYQNMSGIRTKLSSIYIETSLSDFDIIVFVETWFNVDIRDGECLIPMLIEYFRKIEIMQRSVVRVEVEF